MKEQLTLLPEAILASRSALPGTEKARMMTAISGQLCLSSSKSTNQIGLLERMFLGTSIWGSMMCFLTWSVKITNAGRLLFQLVPSAPLTGETDFGLLPTPTSQGGGYGQERHAAGQRQSGAYSDVSIPQGNAANDWSQRMEGFRRETVSRIKGFSWCENVRRAQDYFRLPNIPEPLIRRVGNGLSERLHALGNSVIPQIPEILGYAILETYKF